MPARLGSIFSNTSDSLASPLRRRETSRDITIPDPVTEQFDRIKAKATSSEVVDENGNINWFALMAPLIGLAGGAIAGAKSGNAGTGALIGGTAGAGFLQGTAKGEKAVEKRRQTRRAERIQEEEISSRKTKAERDRKRQADIDELNKFKIGLEVAGTDPDALAKVRDSLPDKFGGLKSAVDGRIAFVIDGKTDEVFDKMAAAMDAAETVEELDAVESLMDTEEFGPKRQKALRSKFKATRKALAEAQNISDEARGLMLEGKRAETLAKKLENADKLVGFGSFDMASVVLSEMGSDVTAEELEANALMKDDARRFDANMKMFASAVGRGDMTPDEQIAAATSMTEAQKTYREKQKDAVPTAEKMQAIRIEAIDAAVGSVIENVRKGYDRKERLEILANERANLELQVGKNPMVPTQGTVEAIMFRAEQALALDKETTHTPEGGLPPQASGLAGPPQVPQVPLPPVPEELQKIPKANLFLPPPLPVDPKPLFPRRR